VEENGRATIREVWAIAQRIEDKLDAGLREIETRVRRLERWRAYLAGASAVVVFGLGLLATYVLR